MNRVGFRSRLSRRIQRSVEVWMDQHNPPAIEHILHLKNLYIFPSKLGWAFLLLAIIIWLLGTNYQNNLILGLAYFQLSFLMVSILHTYYNLAGLTVRFVGASIVHAGEIADVKFELFTPRSRSSHYLTLYFDPAHKAIHEVSSGSSSIECVPIPAVRRGLMNLDRLRLESHFPLGLIRCGSWLRFDAELLVYPKPISCSLPKRFGDDGAEQGQMQLSREGDEFYGMRPYVPGDSPGSVAWKLWARERGLLTVSHARFVDDEESLDWQDFFLGNKELALSNMCFWVKNLHQQGRQFKLILPDETIVVDRGEETVSRGLRLLALA